MTLDAVGEVLKHVKDEKTKVGSGPELLKRAAEQTVLSLEKAKEAEAETENAGSGGAENPGSSREGSSGADLGTRCCRNGHCAAAAAGEGGGERRARDREEAEAAKKAAVAEVMNKFAAKKGNDAAPGRNSHSHPHSKDEPRVDGGGNFHCFCVHRF
ncbi:hypothetical protein TcYC6_0077900 [Trypanosoma cruzi]|nr:hypothetical protein TcYC6_0077900 [Trypanosoma cruzi]